jgi:hypothetical protein
MKNSLLRIKENRQNILERIFITKETGYNEDWLQDVIYKSPTILLNNELFDDDEILIPIGREIPTEAGYIDLLLVTNKGRVIIVETKLWKNPEMQRTVIAQVIDYAKCINKWTIEDFESCLLTNLRKEGKDVESIEKYIKDNFIVYEYTDFLERLSDCLEHGNFLLLIVGDKLAPNLILLRNSIRGNENLEFQIGLMEMQVFKENEEIIISPDVVGRTVEETRAIIKIQYEEKKPVINVIPETVENRQEKTQKGNTSKDEFINKLPFDLQGIYSKYFDIWEKNPKITIYWGKEGFSVRIIEKDKLTTVFDSYPSYFGLLNDKMAGRFENYKNGYIEFVNAIKKNSILANLYVQNKVYIYYEKIDANALDEAFQATNDFISYLLDR